MWQKLLIGIITNAAAYLVGRRVEKYIQDKEEAEKKLKEMENVCEVKEAAAGLSDADYERLLRESTEGSPEFLFDLQTGDIHGSGSNTNAAESIEKGSD